MLGLVGIIICITQSIESTIVIESIIILCVGIFGIYTVSGEHNRTKAYIYKIFTLLAFAICSGFIIISLIMVILYHSLDVITLNPNLSEGYQLLIIDIFAYFYSISLLGAAMSSQRMHSIVTGINK